MENIKIYIFGASGHGKVVADCLKSTDTTVSAIFDDSPNQINWNGISIQNASHIPIADESNQLIIAIGKNSIRKKISLRFDNYFFTTVKHKSAIIASNVFIDEGTVIMANTVINSDSNIGKHTIINTSAVIEHDCVIGDFVHISPKVVLAGHVKVGEGTHIGVGAIVIPKIKIGKWCVIGAGSVIIRDVPDYAVVVGNPGKTIKYTSNE